MQIDPLITRLISRRRMLQSATLGAAGASTLLLTGCTTGALTEGVDAVVVAANLALTVLEGTGVLSPAIVMLVSPYLSNVGQAVIDTNTETQSADTSIIKATKIAAIWANLAGGISLPADAPSIITTVIQNVVGAIKALLAIVGNGQVQLRQAGRTVSQYQLTSGDRRELGRLTKQGVTIKTRAQGLTSR